MESTELEKVLTKTLTKRTILPASKGTVLYPAGQIPKGIFIIHSGMVKYTVFKNRKKITATYEGVGSIHGLSLLFDIKSPFSLEACSRSIQYELITREQLSKAENLIHIIHEGSLDYLNIRISKMVQRLSDLLTLDTSTIIARGLISIAELNGQDYIQAITKKEIAEYANCSVEYVFRTLSMLQRKKAIAMDGQKITLINRKLLQEFTNAKG